ncbi:MULTISPECIES: Rha family transcriptional regulator [Clostridium]|uniref:Rha family transcriptional regulator n=1 Tax=Clostridium botulinum TaxID=1491 RepID=A0ABD7CHN5_CLOBO|nr:MULTISPECIES: Rha family transcriptional regulator [Clostridium]MCC5427830.1 Rha family transcriptional regulator [Clostridium botulinum]MDU5011876.1 Rha family transcriptional regulator [Clostridium botulinum]MDU5117077.1 Rha family transcriptional regulator [Clostridium botulinum]QRI52882.1 Rha family transcriptional regulator [Clostridium botulinum]
MEKVSLSIQNGQPVVTSRQITDDFGKEHSKVIRSIETIIESNSSQNWLQYFIPSEYKDNSGKSNKEYLLTRNGFSLLVMGFTGAKALQWKLKYIEAFNKMEDALRRGNPSLTIKEVVQMIKETRSIMKEQGSSPSEIAIVVKDICEQFNIKLPDCFVKPEETTLNDVYDMIDFIFELPKNKRKDSTYDDYVVSRTINLKLLNRGD